MAFAYLTDDEPVSAVVEAYEAPNLFTLTNQYQYVEKLCEEAIDRQEKLARSHHRNRTAESNIDDRFPESTIGETSLQPRTSVIDLSFSDFQHLNRIARSVVPQGMPNANRRFLMNARQPEVAAIEDHEEEIKLIRYRMSLIEQQILDLAPRSPEEAVEKLKFISSLMLDGGTIEVDLFAYLVEECAFVISEHLG